KILTENVRVLPTSQYIEAKRFLNNFDDAIKALQEENVANYINKDWKEKVTSVAKLVDHMRKRGLRFAPAVSGDEAAYQALYNGLAAYSVAANRAMTSSSKE